MCRPRLPTGHISTCLEGKGWQRLQHCSASSLAALASHAPLQVLLMSVLKLSSGTLL